MVHGSLHPGRPVKNRHVKIDKGNVTSVYGKILKIDSTKKIVKKLAGESKGSAAWATNIGNEYGGILQCVITHSESTEALQLMADGIMIRYSKAKVQPPVAIYTDRDCCNINGSSKINDLFNQLPYLTVRLDILAFHEKDFCRMHLRISSSLQRVYGSTIRTHL